MMKRNKQGRGDRPPAARLGATALALMLLALLILHAPPSAAQQPPEPPSATPDAEAGLALFDERCAVCHGPLGMGDGEQAAQLPVPPAALGSADYVRETTPAQMFEVISNGIVQSGMPPFGAGNSDPLSESERWNLVAAVYSLGQRQTLIDEGQELYEASCQACHAVDGSGEEDAPDLRDQTLWIERSDRDVFQSLSVDPGPEHAGVELQGDALWAAIGYARTFTYDYADAMAAFAPIEEATISGVVINESTGQPLQAGIEATLSAFTADFEPSLTMTTTLEAGGQFQFDLTMAPPDLVYVVTVQHEGISYGSDFGRLARNDPALNLTVPVFERSSDASTVSIEQLHIILQFAEGQAQVSELYQFSQNASTVFVGQSGDPAEGTVRLALPEGASDPSFDRSFGGMESFLPADTVIATENGWADTVPLRPGTGSLSLLVRYSLPYDDGLTLRHGLHYPVSRANLVMPDAGVTLMGEAWQEGPPQVMGDAGVFLTFTQAAMPADQPVQFTLQGEPRPAAAAAATAPAPNLTRELLIGGGVLLLALAAGLYTVRQWRENGGDEGLQRDAPAPAGEARKQALLQEIAALDEAYEAGEIATKEYEAQRQALKEELVAIWEA